MTVFTWLSKNPSIIISGVSTLISACALIVAIGSQQISRQMAERSGRLRRIALTKMHVGTRRYTRAFTAMNGPDEVTLTEALLRITYELADEEQLWTVRRFVRYLRPTSFELLGIQGPCLPKRLAPYDEAKWQLPRRAFNFSHTTTIAGKSYDQHVSLCLELTSSGSKLVSDSFDLGTKHTTFRIATDSTVDQHLEELLEDAQEPRFGVGMSGLYEWLCELIEAAANSPDPGHSQ